MQWEADSGWRIADSQEGGGGWGWRVFGKENMFKNKCE
jgi:hypothetical protein